MFFILLSECINGQLIRCLDSQLSRNWVRCCFSLGRNLVFIFLSSEHIAGQLVRCLDSQVSVGIESGTGLLWVKTWIGEFSIFSMLLVMCLGGQAPFILFLPNHRSLKNSVSVMTLYVSFQLWNAQSAIRYQDNYRSPAALQVKKDPIPCKLVLIDLC